MLQRTCDRCGDLFKVSTSQAGDEVYQSLGTEKKTDPPLGLKLCNTIIVPRPIAQPDPKSPPLHCLAKIDLCAKCALDLVPVISDWYAEKRKTR